MLGYLDGKGQIVARARVEILLHVDRTELDSIGEQLGRVDPISVDASQGLRSQCAGDCEPRTPAAPDIDHRPGPIKVEQEAENFLRRSKRTGNLRVEESLVINTGFGLHAP